VADETAKRTDDASPGQNQGQNHKNKFDWITQRHACSLPTVFKELRLQIEQDVKTRNGLRPNNAPYEFSLTDTDGGFKVLLKAKELEMAVTFTLGEHAILVRDDKGVQMFEVTLSFNDQGECQLKVNGEERNYWQVRRMALEELMFRGN
jgi:hypothetical protein